MGYSVSLIRVTESMTCPLPVTPSLTCSQILQGIPLTNPVPTPKCFMPQWGHFLLHSLHTPSGSLLLPWGARRRPFLTCTSISDPPPLPRPI